MLHRDVMPQGDGQCVPGDAVSYTHLDVYKRQVQEGLDSGKVCYIISDQSRKIAQLLMEELERGVTLLSARGMYSGEDKEVLLCVVTRMQLVRLKRIVSRVDPEALVLSLIHILSGQYGPGQKLQSVREMAGVLAVNPNTLQRALGELEKEGLVFTQRTNGRFIAEDLSLIHI